MAAKAVNTVRKHYPAIILSMLIPYHPAQRPVDVPAEFDNTFYPPGMEKVPPRFAIVRANRYMIDHSDYLIAYACYPATNTWNLLEYAGRKEISVTNLASVLKTETFCGTIK